MKITAHVELDRETHTVTLEVTGHFGRYSYGDGSPSGYELDDYTYEPELIMLNDKEKEKIENALYREMEDQS